MNRVTASAQLSLFGAGTVCVEASDTTSTFADNVSLPIHRWFRYPAGFSALWVRRLLDREKARGRRTVLDPFAGSGTAPLEAEAAGLEAVGVEAHPFVARIARAKLLWRTEVASYRSFAESTLRLAKRLPPMPKDAPTLLQRCFPSEILARLFSLRSAWATLRDDSPQSELTWLTLMSILRECSPVGTAQWQYVLPNKSKARAADPFQALAARIQVFASDMTARQRMPCGPVAQIHQQDARTCESVHDGWADLVVTSPPYANNYDYADATRLEMTFGGEINGWGDLQDAVRKYLVRSCSQHVAPIAARTEEILADALLDPIRNEIVEACGQLRAERGSHGGKKTYHTMVAAYFSDLARVWVSLRRVAAKGALVCFVVGDSAPYGVHVPVDRWLGQLAVSAGFHSFTFEKTRDRNIKWKNRKHRVPLHEGRLWIEG